MSPPLGLVIAGGFSTRNTGFERFETSSDGSSFSLVTTALDNTASVYTMNSVAANSSVIVGIGGYFGNSGSKIVSSSDGSTWTSRTGPLDGSANWAILGVCWSDALGLFIIVGSNNGSSVVFTSPDGITWTSRTVPNIGQLNKVVASGSLVVAVANGGSVVTSPDGITWTNRGASGLAQGFGIAWLSGAALFIIVGYQSSGSFRMVVTSPDGITWTTATTPFDSNVHTFYGVGCKSDLAVIIGFDFSGNTQRICTSPDGVTWTSRTPTNLNGSQFVSGSAVVWDSALNSWFVGVIPSSGNSLVSSPDGITWSAVTHSLLGVSCLSAVPGPSSSPGRWGIPL